jgi:hypothetical protein
MQPTGREMHGDGGQDDLFNQMLSTLPAAWTELGSGSKSPWELPAEDPAFDDSALLASRLRHHQIGDKPVMLHLSDLHGEDGANAGFLPLPLFTDRSREDMDAAAAAAFKSPNAAVRVLGRVVPLPALTPSKLFIFFHLL